MEVWEEESVEQTEVQQTCNESQQGFLSSMFPIRESCPSGRTSEPGVWTPAVASACALTILLTLMGGFLSVVTRFQDRGAFWGFDRARMGDDAALAWNHLHVASV